MRRLLIVAALLLFLPVWSEAQSCDGCGIGYMAPGGLSELVSSGTTVTSSVPFIVPDGTAANPGFGFTSAPTTGIYLSGANIYWSFAGVGKYIFASTSIIPAVSDSVVLGSAAGQFQSAYVARLQAGGKSKVLTESTETGFVEIDLAQNASMAGEIGYSIRAYDATNFQIINGRLRYWGVNEAGTVACGIADVGTPSDGTPTGTLTATFDCTEANADRVMFRANAVSSLTQTAVTIYYRVDTPDSPVVRPQ